MLPHGRRLHRTSGPAQEPSTTRCINWSAGSYRQVGLCRSQSGAALRTVVDLLLLASGRAIHSGNSSTHQSRIVVSWSRWWITLFMTRAHAGLQSGVRCSSFWMAALTSAPLVLCQERSRHGVDDHRMFGRSHGCSPQHAPNRVRKTRRRFQQESHLWFAVRLFQIVRAVGDGRLQSLRRINHQRLWDKGLLLSQLASPSFLRSSKDALV